ncbi:MAG: flagellar hook-associated protein FlgL [Nitrospirae bacterium]|nr:flagellar hook-associated protein FlgL [Nitrospirota bacterium]
MRVSDKSLYNTITNNLQAGLERLLQLQESASSGKRINRPSDDPSGVIKVMDYDTAISKVEQHERNVGNGNSNLTATESAISSVQEVVQRAKELTVQASDASNDSSDRAIIAKEVEQIYNQVLSTANTKVNGKYIFAGYNNSTAPYSSDGTYNGTYPGGYMEVEVDSGSTVEINMPGYMVFGSSAYGTNILSALNSLQTALENNNTDGIGTAMTTLDSSLEQLNNARAEVGAKTNRLDTAKSYLSKLKLDLTDFKSQTEDADLTEVITKLTMQQNSVEISRASVSRVLQQSIMDFLK